MKQSSPTSTILLPLAGAVLALALSACAGGDQVRAGTPPPAAATPAAADADPGSVPAAASDATGEVAIATDAVQPPVADASGDPAAAAEGAGQDADDVAGPTQAELDYAAIYGEDVYNPVADPTLPPPAQMPTSHDPWEPFNRRMHGVNKAIDRTVALPLARAYVNVVPRPVRLGVGNFFSNLGQPVSAVNALLQGKPKQAAQALGRFVLNTTLGIGGIFDPASDASIPHRSEDFGQTLGVWGWESSRYLELPLFGPRTVRDVFGLVGDAPLSPTRQIDDDAARIGLQGLQLVDIRTQLMAVDRMREGAADEYALVRDAWLQRRNYQIHGDR
ncbi:MAG: MlaA family lipoprotein, partial [Luteimonas sp.]